MGGFNLCGSSVCGAFLDGLNLVLCLKIPASPGAVLEWQVPWRSVAVKGELSEEEEEHWGSADEGQADSFQPASDQQGPSV